jgi:hypothetical protein
VVGELLSVVATVTPAPVMDDQLPRVSALITERSPHMFCVIYNGTSL